MNEMTNKTAVGTADSGRPYVEDLLSRYPAITDAEKLAILDFLNKSSALDSALLTCNEAIAENLKAFRQDNRKQLLSCRYWPRQNGKRAENRFYRDEIAGLNRSLAINPSKET